jgi:hypothetical protein
MGFAYSDGRCESTFIEVEGTFGRGACDNRAEFDKLLHRVRLLTNMARSQLGRRT